MPPVRDLIRQAAAFGRLRSAVITRAQPPYTRSPTGVIGILTFDDLAGSAAFAAAAARQTGRPVRVTPQAIVHLPLPPPDHAAGFGRILDTRLPPAQLTAALRRHGF